VVVPARRLVSEVGDGVWKFVWCFVGLQLALLVLWLVSVVDFEGGE